MITLIAGTLLLATGIEVQAVAPSPVRPPEASDRMFIVDEDSGLDTDCTYRADGPLVVHLPITRYVGEVNGDGTLRDPESMIAAGLISAKAHLRMPVYDVDIDASSRPDLPPEFDYVLFNGTKIEQVLTGSNNTWKPNDLQVPIELVKFPPPGANGSPPPPADNVIEISIDEKGGGARNWCTALDWVALSIKAVAPVVLVHGVDSRPSAWSPDVTDALDEANVPYALANLTPNGSIAANGRQLAGQLSDIATSFGVKSCHLIAHSKGGLDALEYLNHHYNPDEMRVLSLTTLSTPFRGSILADISVAARTKVHPGSADYDVHQVIAGTAFGASPPAIDDLTVAARGNTVPRVPPDVAFLSYAGNADNGDRILSSGEAAGYPTLIANTMFRVVGTVADIEVTPANPSDLPPGVINSYPDVKVLTRIDPVRYANDGFRYNDCVVTVASATGAGVTPVQANHNTIKSRPIEQILNRIIASAGTDTP